MSQDPARVRICPLCGSKNVALVDPDREQLEAGASCVLKCECGAIVTLYIQQKGKNGTAKGRI